MITDLVQSIRMQLQRKNTFDIARLYGLEFLTIGDRPLLIGRVISGSRSTEINYLLDGNLNPLASFPYWRNGRYAITQLQGQEVLAIQQWSGKEREIPIGNGAAQLLPVGRSVAFLDKNLMQVHSMALPDAIDGFSLKDVAFNGKNVLMLQDFDSLAIIDPDEGVKLVQPEGYCNEYSNGRSNLVKLTRKDGEYFFGFSSLNANEVIDNSFDNNAALLQLRTPQHRFLQKFTERKFMEGQFVLYDRNYQGTLISRRDLGLSRSSYIIATEQHQVGERNLLLIGEVKKNFSKSSFIYHLYDHEFNKILDVEGFPLFECYRGALSGGITYPYLAYIDKETCEYKGQRTGLLRVLDENLESVCTVPQSDIQFDKFMLALDGEKYVVSSPFFQSFLLSDKKGQPVFAPNDGVASMEQLLSGGFLESFAIINYQGNDYLCMDEYKTFALSVYNGNFDKVSSIDMRGNEFKRMCLTGPRNKFNFSLIPLLQYHARNI